MRYYECKGNLYTSNIPIINDEFIEITQEEYELRLGNIKVEQVPPSTEDEWFVNIDEATEQDYQDALAEMGVEL